MRPPTRGDGVERTPEGMPMALTSPAYRCPNTGQCWRSVEAWEVGVRLWKWGHTEAWDGGFGIPDEPFDLEVDL